jgi:cyclase
MSYHFAMTLTSRTRRRLLQAAAGTWLGAYALGASRVRAQVGLTSQRLGERLYMLTAGDVNVLVQTDRDGALLVDGGAAAMSEVLLAAVVELAPGGIHTLLNTHWHPEQTGLNEHVGRAGGTLIAQENTRLWLSTDIVYPWDGQRFDALPEIARPNRSFHDEGDVVMGAHYGHLRHAAHTDGDLYVYFPEDDVLGVGGAASGAGWPLVDWWTGGWIGGIVGTLELILALANAETRIVPANGRILTRSDIEAQYEMYNTIYERLAQLLNRGRGPDEAIAARPTEEFDALMGPSELFVRRAFESLWAYLSPDA